VNGSDFNKVIDDYIHRPARNHHSNAAISENMAVSAAATSNAPSVLSRLADVQAANARLSDAIAKLSEAFYPILRQVDEEPAKEFSKSYSGQSDVASAIEGLEFAVNSMTTRVLNLAGRCDL